jgi:hypothetical protein
VVSHRSTDNAITSLTSEIGRDPVLFGVYGRSYYFDNFDGLYSCVLSKDDGGFEKVELAVDGGHSGRLQKWLQKTIVMYASKYECDGF